MAGCQRCLSPLVIVALLAPTSGVAEPRPLWEVGAGVAALRLPDYRGSDESRNYVYPLPFFIYRGDALRIDREGARARFFEAGRARLDLSLYATPPVDSQRDRARSGMPNLDPTVEIGPMLRIALLDEPRRERRLEFRLPLRAAIATNLSRTRLAGFVLYPHINADTRLGGWAVGVQGGALFASAQYHRYFYGVDPAFATADRPAYEARGGYSGFAALASVSRRVGRLWIGAFARYDSLRGAVFEASPLVRRSDSLMAGIGIAWVFAESAARVDASE